MHKVSSLLAAMIFGLVPSVLQVLSEEWGGTAQAGYYEGKTIKVIEGRRPGGTGSLRTHITVKYLVKYLGGKTTTVIQYMPGGGGTGAANQIAKVAKKDGLTLGNVSSGVLSNAILGARGVRYDLDDFVLLGSGSPGGATTISIRPALKIDSVEKLKAYKGLRFANRSVGHSMYVRDRLTAFVLELDNPIWVLGYNDAEIRLALERGEADASFGGIAGLLRESPHWIRDGFTFPVYMKDSKGQGSEAYPKFTQGNPSLDQFADTQTKKALLALHYATTPGGSIFFVHKDIPPAALKDLDEAFEKIWRDKQFAEEYERITNQAASPMTGKDYMRLVQNRPRDPKILDLYKELIGGGPMPKSR